MITTISFDLDGTLTNEKFDFLIWNEEIPKLYAQTHKVDLETAKMKVFAEYYKALYIDDVENFTNIDYWFTRLGLSNWRQLMDDLKHHILRYDDVIPTLEALHGKYQLIMISNSEHHFLDIKLEATGIRKYFDHTFSAPGDFGVLKKDVRAFTKVLERLQLKPQQIIHVGNETMPDITVPSSIGIRCFLIDREHSTKGDHVLHSLSELQKKLSQ